MKKNFLLLLAIGALLATGCKTKTAPTVLKTDVPARPAGQENVIGLRTEPLETVRIGVVGLGMRGGDAVERLTYVPGAVITALCDVVPERVAESQAVLAKRGMPAAKEYTGAEDAYKALCQQEDLDLVYICTDWSHHVPVALCAMENGKHAAVEVPAAGTLEDIWALINTSERTRKHCIMLENCCYDFFELSTLAMVQAGAIGEPIHAEGSYQHNLDPFWKAYWDNWRLKENQQHRGDLYPTHGLGPVCQVLNIHRGDRMKTLVAMDTEPFNGAKMSEKLYGKPDATFAAGDQTTTLIRTEKGKTILVEHDVMTPRPYSRMYQIVGTDGYAAKYPVSMLCFRESRCSASASLRKVSRWTPTPWARRKCTAARRPTRCSRSTRARSSRPNSWPSPRKWAATAAWTTSWTTGWSIACATACRWTWTCTTSPNGAASPRSPGSPSRTATCRWKSPTSPAVPGTS